MFWLFHFLILYLSATSGANPETVEFLTLYDSTSEGSGQNAAIAVSVSDGDLTEVSRSVLMAESWVRSIVLASFPATKITTIVVGNNVVCNNKDQEEGKLELVLLSLKNIYYSLKRWGLEKEIKPSSAFSFECFVSNSALNEALSVLHFLEDINSTISLNPPEYEPDLSHEAVKKLVSNHLRPVQDLGVFNLKRINVIVQSPIQTKPTKIRRLSMFDSSPVDVGYSIPAHVTKKPQPPLASFAPPPSISLTFGPPMPPIVVPAQPPFGLSMPPCSSPSPAADMSSPPPAESVGGIEKGLWCVAKPSVPVDTLQLAMDYACGVGGADCEDIRPHGSCFYPDTVVAHASYAFNSYWQKTKRNGGTCSFDGTAMIINADPSFQHCRFILS
ncbi:X8 domain [Dillenia turbinata]|uniref:X8 domain n=1 Tax=Dillenia turbinata TaxID=194707 RepID=A0AAN8V5K4_9MAGN